VSTHCQHCGNKLPWVVDAFCPSCSNRLDEPPSPVAPAGAAPAAGKSAGVGALLGLLMMLGGVLALFPGALSLVSGNWGDALYTGGVGVALIIGGAFWKGRSARR